jgi:hypothetical protein
MFCPTLAELPSYVSVTSMAVANCCYNSRLPPHQLDSAPRDLLPEGEMHGPTRTHPTPQHGSAAPSSWSTWSAVGDHLTARSPHHTHCEPSPSTSKDLCSIHLFARVNAVRPTSATYMHMHTTHRNHTMQPGCQATQCRHEMPPASPPVANVRLVARRSLDPSGWAHRSVGAAGGWDFVWATRSSGPRGGARRQRSAGGEFLGGALAEGVD